MSKREVKKILTIFERKDKNNCQVIFHKRVRAFYQGLQTRENNENHEAVGRVIFVVLECFTNAREH